MVQALFDEGALARNGAVKVARPLSQLRLPPTVPGILAARIDRLLTEQKELLQTLAVIGRESPLGLIRRVAYTAEAQLERMLSDLQAGEFIYEQPSASGVAYTFKHALTQEVACNSLLIERRKLLHEGIGDAIESLYASSLDDHLAELAHHYSHSANLAKSVEYLERAAQQAVSRSAFREALSLGQAGVGMITALPATGECRRREFNLHYSLVLAASVIEGFGSPQRGHSYRRMHELARESGDDATLSIALAGMWIYHHLAARHQEAAEVARQMLGVAEHRKTPAALADAHSAQGFTLYWTGHAGEALTEFNRAIAICPDGAGRISFDGSDPLVATLIGAAPGRLS
jgi:tetratricopeptide (TPR) repeat protein